MPRETLTEVAIDLLRRHLCRTTAEIAAEAVARRVTRAKDPGASVRKALRWDDRFVDVRPDAWVLSRGDRGRSGGPRSQGGGANGRGSDAGAPAGGHRPRDP